jgi:hypothetical protein
LEFDRSKVFGLTDGLRETQAVNRSELLGGTKEHDRTELLDSSAISVSSPLEATPFYELSDFGLESEEFSPTLNLNQTCLLSFTSHFNSTDRLEESQVPKSSLDLADSQFFSLTDRFSATETFSIFIAENVTNSSDFIASVPSGKTSLSQSMTFGTSFVFSGSESMNGRSFLNETEIVSYEEEFGVRDGDELVTKSQFLGYLAGIAVLLLIGTGFWIRSAYLEGSLRERDLRRFKDSWNESDEEEQPGSPEAESEDRSTDTEAPNISDSLSQILGNSEEAPVIAETEEGLNNEEESGETEEESMEECKLEPEPQNWVAESLLKEEPCDGKAISHEKDIGEEEKEKPGLNSGENEVQILKPPLVVAIFADEDDDEDKVEGEDKVEDKVEDGVEKAVNSEMPWSNLGFVAEREPLLWGNYGLEHAENGE